MTTNHETDSNLTADTAFIKRRRRLLKLWPWAGSALLLMLLFLAAWMWIRVPYMINPWLVLEQIEAGTLADSTMLMMAGMLPVVMVAFLGFVAATIVILFTAFSNERRMLGIIRRFRGEDSELS